jgi:hypothetical protein
MGPQTVQRPGLTVIRYTKKPDGNRVRQVLCLSCDEIIIFNDVREGIATQSSIKHVNNCKKCFQLLVMNTDHLIQCCPFVV